MPRLPFRFVFCLTIAIGLSGCLAEDPSSFRQVDGLLPGLWTMIEEPPAPPTVEFQPDLTFSSTSNGVPGALVSNFSGNYWQASEVIAFRGTGPVEGVRVQFVKFRIQESPLMLTMWDIADAYVEELVGITDINQMSNSDVQSALRRLDGLPIPDSAIGFTFEYLK